ncbi:MAG: hypothetical protein ACTSQP_06930 [Promethearchaeota archaeon]
MSNENCKINAFDKEKVFKKGLVYCPLCHQEIYAKSEYLLRVFGNNIFQYMAAVLVMHYRHYHIQYYDLSWKYYRYREYNIEYQEMGHHDYKIMVNNRAKRQLINAILFNDSLETEIKKEMIKGFIPLQHNDNKTKKKIKDSLIALEIEGIGCQFCIHPAKYIIISNGEQYHVCGIHKRKKEFKNLEIIDLRKNIEQEINKLIA